MSLTNWGKRWTLFHQCLACGLSRSVSIYIAVQYGDSDQTDPRNCLLSSRSYPFRDVKDQDNWENLHTITRRRALLHFAHWCLHRPDSWQAGARGFSARGFIARNRKLQDNVEFTGFAYCCLEKFNECRKIYLIDFLASLVYCPV